MPSRNTVKQYTEDSYYHVYNHGVDGRDIFLDEQDYTTFLSLLKRHLSRTKEYSSRNIEYESYAGRVELLVFCLMPSHFNLLLYLNNDEKAISELMRKVSGTYTSYFNKKYNRVGHLFQGVYKASKVTDEHQLLLASRHIHRKPADYHNWNYSSLRHYIGDEKSDWVVPDRVYRLYDWGTYESFLNDYTKDSELEEKLFG